MLTFNTVLNDYFPKLEMYTLPLTRAHGENHPEVFDVRELFQTMNTKVKDSDKPDLDKEFKRLRKVTNNYELPTDACETYEAVYTMLSEADEAYYV
ncbi:iron-sulfur cluster repair di-iron protein, ric [Alkalibacterium sp. 20]|uniref:iron-sulfur cluster repair di-iron protein, ric n=1 Tax=Alkalibacterium sp. 20 TaxID=1798803 RepID=UPI0009002608|nr:iron-sulfur cluster repair di-iron protein, ric [Alkalibacterium sp. 20]OJF91852.1 iron-sulfur cluster repair di-iron protein, ric [Alkalibacterium sp. 20]